MPGSNTLPFLRVIDGQDSNRPGGSSSVSLGSVRVSSGFFVPASKSRSVSGSIHLFLTFAHGVCASSAGPFLADAPSLVSKAEVSGPRQEGLRGHSPSGPEQLLVGCSAEEILLPRLPRLLSTSLLCRQVLAPPSLLDCSEEVRGNGAPRSRGRTPAFYCQPDAIFSVYVGQKNKTQGRGCRPVSFSLVRLLAEQRMGSLLTRDYRTVHPALASTHPLGHS